MSEVHAGTFAHMSTMRHYNIHTTFSFCRGWDTLQETNGLLMQFPFKKAKTTLTSKEESYHVGFGERRMALKLILIELSEE